MTGPLYPDNEGARYHQDGYIGSLMGRDIYTVEVVLVSGVDKIEIMLVTADDRCWKGYTLSHIKGYAKRSKVDFWAGLAAMLALKGLMR